MTIEALLRSAPPNLAPLDAELLLARVVNRERTWLLAHPDAPVAEAAVGRFERWASRCAEGAPVAYLIGEKEFFGRTFTVTPAVLCPRPDSELLVELTLARLRPGDTLVEIGTGSGCIGLSVCLERPGTPAILTDISPDALAVAKQNARRHAVPHVRFLEVDGWPKDLRTDPARTVVVANLPYLTPDETDRLPHEPRVALDGGSDGLDAIRRLLRGLERAACIPRHLLLEHAPRHAAPIRGLAGRPAKTYRDLAGRGRVTEF